MKKIPLPSYVDGVIKQRPPPPSSPRLPVVHYSWSREKKSGEKHRV
jgi:hypothetical protein